MIAGDLLTRTMSYRILQIHGYLMKTYLSNIGRGIVQIMTLLLSK
jgi:hypothetical protein